jgi:hypothetical protein|tara:strand:- start:617 stop:769 length:153 start_codon:yes stop_codon:yes gene_type:complete
MNGAITKQSRVLVMFAQTKYIPRSKKIQLVLDISGGQTLRRIPTATEMGF